MHRVIHHVVGVLVGAMIVCTPRTAEARKLKVVVTSSAYRNIAEYIGGDRIEVSHIVNGNQDPHVVRPKPSLAVLLRSADLYVATGLDLEMWSQALVDMSGNPKIRSGQVGYISASAGISLIEKPTTITRAEGDVHIYGNPHIHTSPLNCKTIAENICVGLKRIDPGHTAQYQKNLDRFKADIDRRTFGPELVRIMGGKLLSTLAESGRLVPFLKRKQFRGAPLIDKLGGWFKAAMPLRGRRIVAYHKNISYFSEFFGIEIVDYLEPKPGIPPSPRHIAEVLVKMRNQHIRILWAENYFDIGLVRRVAGKVGAIPVVVALGPGGQPGMNTVFDMFDIWIRELRQAFLKAYRGA